MIEVSVVIPTYNDWERLQLCLDALASQSLARSCYEVIVVNNNPNSAPPAWLTLEDNVKLLEESKPGSYAARNRALSIAQGKYIAFTDSDCIPAQDWLESGLSIFQNNPDVCRVGGAIDLILQGEKPTVAEVYELFFAFRQEEFVGNDGMAATANMMAKREVFDHIGWFNDSLMSGGDAEWGIRAQANGYRIIYAENVIVNHPSRSKLKELVQKTKREAGGHLNLLNGEPRLKIYFNILIGVLPPVKSLRRLVHVNKYGFKFKVIAFGVRYFLRLVSMNEKLSILLAGKNPERV